MKWLIAAFLLCSSAAALGETSFDDYIAKNKKRQIVAREAATFDVCGMKCSNAQVIYGLGPEVEGYKLHRIVASCEEEMKRTQILDLGRGVEGEQ